MKNTLSSFWNIFRPIFVIFSLYLMGDAFYRWDGFRYHSSFSDFLPSVALVAVFWSILAVLLSIITWLLIILLEKLFALCNIKLKSNHLFFFLLFTGIIGTLVVFLKQLLIRKDIPLSIELTVILLTILAAIFVTRISRNKFDLIQERITPLLWQPHL